jgi:hypothetical protein
MDARFCHARLRCHYRFRSYRFYFVFYHTTRNIIIYASSTAAATTTTPAAAAAAATPTTLKSSNQRNVNFTDGLLACLIDCLLRRQTKEVNFVSIFTDHECIGIPSFSFLPLFVVVVGGGSSAFCSEFFVSVGPVGIDGLELLQEGVGFVDFLLLLPTPSTSTSSSITRRAAPQDLQYLEQPQNDPLAVGRILQDFPKEIRLFREAFFETLQEVIVVIILVVVMAAAVVFYQLVQ